MPKIKYFEGDYINNILFVKRLKGIRPTKGIFQCPFCNKMFQANIANIVSKNTKSCGCWNKEQCRQIAYKNKKDFSNQRFGMLLVLEDTGKVSCGGNRIWKCKCDCGNIVEKPSSDFKQNAYLSCGCLTLSSGEKQVLDILKKNNLNFKKEKTFSDCVNPKTNFKLRFDFYLPDYNCCIEYDGKQHYSGWKGKETLEEIQYRDNIKNQYCKENEIKLIRIPYWENHIEEFLLKQLKEN